MENCTMSENFTSCRNDRYPSWEALLNYDYEGDSKIQSVVSSQHKFFGFMWYIANPTDTIKLMDEYPRPDFVRDLANDAFPAMAFLILGEMFITRLLHKRWIEPAEAFPNIGHGIILQTIRLLIHATEFALYDWCFEKWHWLPDDIRWDTWYAWIFVMVTLDLCYYVFHRTAHEMAFLWSFHQVHHSSNSFNFSSAIRIPHFHDFAHFGIYYCPLALIGVPPKVAFMHKTLNLLYQFWTHTELVPKLPYWFEFIFNSPSHHRVHHGRNPRYLDKNYGSLFIIWDRMFGTFQEEDEPAVYGLTTPITTLDIATTQYRGFFELYNKVKQQKTISEKIQAVFKGPGWQPGTPWCGDPAMVPKVDGTERASYPELPWFWTIYIWVQYLSFTGLFGLFLMRHEVVPNYILVLMVFYMYYAGWSTACIMEKKSYAVFLEIMRLSLCWMAEPYVVAFYANYSPVEQLVCSIINLGTTLSVTACIIFIIDRIRIKSKYLETLI